MKSLLTFVCVVAAQGAAVAAQFPVEPFTLYRAEKACDIQFYDKDGRKLHFGAYPNSDIATSPARAAFANVRLEKFPIPVPHAKGIPITTPHFWQETSKVVSNTGSTVEIEPGGYAVSIPVPADVFAISHEPVNGDGRDGGAFAHPCRLWYDGEMRPLGGTHALEQAKGTRFVRFTIVHSKHNRGFALYNARLKPYEPYASEPHPGEIVLPVGCDLRERWAAVQLVRWVKHMTGKTLPVVTEPSASAEFRLIVGRKPAEGKFDDALKELKGTDGYAIRVRGKDVYLFGATGRGAIRAAAKFLEDTVDFIWWRPNVSCGVSFTPCAELPALKAKDALSIPRFERSTWSTGGGDQFNYDDWVAWNFTSRLYRPGDQFSFMAYGEKERGFYCQIGGSYLSLPLSVEKRDDFYPFVDGKRQVGSPVGQPCFSNPDVVRATVKGAEKAIAEAPEEADVFLYDYSDSWVVCECDKCCAPYRLPDGRMLACKAKGAVQDPVFRSTRTYMVANEVAKRVRELRPGMETVMLAYIYMAANPEVKLDKDIRLLFATYDTSTMRFPTMDQTRGVCYAPESWATRFRRWLDREPQAMGMWEYFFTASPAMFSEAAAANMREMAKSGRGHVHSQSQTDDAGKAAESFGRNEQMWDVNAMDQWMIARLMWDPFQDVDALRRQFLERAYGKAAATILREGYRLFAKAFFDKDYAAWFNCHTPATEIYLRFIVKPGIEAQLYSILDRALAACDRSCGKRQIERWIATLKDMKAAMGRDAVPHVPELTGEWLDVSSPQWNKAYRVPAFREALSASAVSNLSTRVTEVDFACDRRYLYFRVKTDAKPQESDRVELVFQCGKATRNFSLANDGTTCDFSDYDPSWESGWEVRGRTGRIPMAAIREKPDAELKYVVRRFAANGTVSFGRSLENRASPFPGTEHRTFSPLVPEVDSDLGGALPAPLTYPTLPTREMPFVFTNIPVRAGNAYKLRFNAMADRTFLPEDYTLLCEASRCPDQFWRWCLVFRDASGREVQSVTSPTRTVKGTKPRRYQDVFRAPDGAASVDLKFIPSHFVRFPSKMRAAKARLDPFDAQGSLIVDWNFTSDDVRSSFGHLTGGSGMRVFRGERVFETGYACFSPGFPANAGAEFHVELERWRYPNPRYTSINVWFLDANGRKIKDTIVDTGLTRKDGLVAFGFSCPPGTKSAQLMFFDTYLKWIKVTPKAKNGGTR